MSSKNILLVFSPLGQTNEQRLHIWQYAASLVIAMPRLSSMMVRRLLSVVPELLIGHAAVHAPHDRHPLNSGFAALNSFQSDVSVSYMLTDFLVNVV